MWGGGERERVRVCFVLLNATRCFSIEQRPNGVHSRCLNGVHSRCLWFLLHRSELYDMTSFRANENKSVVNSTVAKVHTFHANPMHGLCDSRLSPLFLCVMYIDEV